ncbi:MAG TPA: PP2C family protein-serine/threonine phosphatase [Terriglobia bacterium]|nr:PP2C family protein-serine/threonine phosphatase [Terriglobia bacterium]
MPASIVNLLIREYRSRPMARFTAWLLAFGAALWLESIISGSAPAVLWVVFVIGLAVSAGYYIVRLASAFKHHIIWHLRRRLVVTYIFIAVVPVVLILVLAGVGAVIANGQFAAFLVTLNVNDHVERMAQLNRIVAHQAYMSRAKTPEELLDQLEQFYVQQLSQHSANYPGLEIVLRVGNQQRAFSIKGGPIRTVPAIPAWLKAEEFSGVVADGDRLLLRSADQGNAPAGPISMILSEPFSPELMDLLGMGIGPVGIIQASASVVSMQSVKRTLPGSDAGAPQEKVIARSESVYLAPRANWLDAGVFGTSSLDVIRWDGAEKQSLSQPVFVYVSSRLSILSRHLLATLGRYSRIYLTLFLVIAVVFLTIELLSLVAGIRLARTITGTVDRLYEATEHIRAGDLSHRIKLPAQDQLSSLGGAFDNMMESLQGLLRESQEKTRLEHDIQIAREIQEQLFPSGAPKVAGLELYGICRPARGVSGDYYDFLLLGSGKVGMVLGDVSGKGVSAALIMAAIHSLIRTRLYLESSDGKPDADRFSTARFFSVLNQQLFEYTPEEKYATCFYALYDSGTRRLVYTNAGHPAPLLFRKGEVVRLDAGGTPLGLISPTSYCEAKVELEPGDTLIAFTDGFTESENSFEDQFGESRLIEVVRRARGDPLPALVEEVYRSVEEWTGGGEPQDDMTLIVARAMSS